MLAVEAVMTSVFSVAPAFGIAVFPLRVPGTGLVLQPVWCSSLLVFLYNTSVKVDSNKLKTPQPNPQTFYILASRM